mmetsp:Transcript_13771/g.20302  ORF Transcript_13771/g.20302 Transcript_13771/m.20302 type:complete len:533 (-) Transcript_13771:484-2082(-)|eukprot:CAMPEP_0194200350 /NCGR_PEP_ID=MMETSP0156-20130528/991_1 /TAXON_ID=33649 /ORGANISM="Thalassionema nitzschioides, Strain L26-B" /LENGTH=532 /DNA_ID=CAMNT_0038925331 /DNA_START=68 /DNA_END=1669 /DNA_ORIENTATION=+
MAKLEEKADAEKQDDLIERLTAMKDKWKDEEEDDTDRLLNDAIAYSLEQGKGWAEGEREEYLKKILDDDFIPPIFAETPEELEASGLSEAFSSLKYDEPPSQYMLDAKKKGNEAFMNGKRNEAKNMQYYRDAVNHYYEAFAWSKRVEHMSNDEKAQAENKEICFTEEELDQAKSVICANSAMAHTQLKNWGLVRDESKKALVFDKENVKAWYRLAKAYQHLQNWEEAGDAIDKGLEGDPDNKDLKKLERILAEKVRRARLARQKRERKRAERVSKVKEVWTHCKDNGIKLGRVPLVTSVTDDDEDEDESAESRWHHHHPHTGKLPEKNQGQWSWPCMFVYPSHNQSDFIQHFGESDILATQMADIFPELEDCTDNKGETSVPWDYNNEFQCSKLAVYLEVHGTEGAGEPVHPDSVEILKSQADTMKFYEASRALKGDEGPDITNLARALERKHLHTQRKAWKKKHGSLWAKPDPTPVLRIHPAMILRDLLADKRIVIPNFLVTFVLFPDNHPAHQEYLRDHKCVELIEPSDS